MRSPNKGFFIAYSLWAIDPRILDYFEQLPTMPKLIFTALNFGSVYPSRAVVLTVRKMRVRKTLGLIMSMVYCWSCTQAKFGLSSLLNSEISSAQKWAQYKATYFTCELFGLNRRIIKL